MSFNHRRVANWSVVGGLINTVASARCFFIHEWLVGAWLGSMALLMVAQFYVAGKAAEETVKPRDLTPPS